MVPAPVMLPLSSMDGPGSISSKEAVRLSVWNCMDMGCDWTCGEFADGDTRGLSVSDGS